jgi:MFS family permease
MAKGDGGTLRRTGRAWGAVAAFFAANVLFGAGLFAHAFVYNFYLEGLAHGPVVMGNAAAALTAGGLSALIPAGIVVDRRGAATGYRIAVLIAGLGLGAGAFAESRAAIYGAAFFAGAGTALWRVSMGPLLMRLAGPAIRARAFSWNVALLVGSGALWTVAAGAAPGWLGARFGFTDQGAYRAVLLGGAALTLFAALGAWRSGLRAPAVPEEEKERAGEGFRGMPRYIVAGVLLVAVWMTASALVLPFFNVYFAREHEMAVVRVGLVLGAAQAVTALALFASGEAAQRLGPGRVLVAWMLVFAPLLWALGAVDALALAVPLFLLQGFVAPATNPLIDQVLLDRAPASRHGAVSSLRNAATEVSGLVGASVGGRLLAAVGFGGLFTVAGGVALAGAAGLALWLRRAYASGGSSTRTDTLPRSSL